MTSGEKTCFIAMPVRTTDDHAKLFADPDHWKHVMDWLFVAAIEAAGFTPWRPVATGSDLIHAEIVRQLEQADMVLCDMSQNNPNVFFELGVRTSVNKPVALVRCDSSVSIPFDVSVINAHTYNPTLRPWSMGSEIEALKEHLTRAEETCAGNNPMWRHFGLRLTAQEPTSDNSPEDAKLELIVSKMDNMDARLNALVHATQTPDTVRRTQPDEDWRSPSNILKRSIAAEAGGYGLEVETIEFRDRDIVYIAVKSGDSSDYAAFVQVVSDELERYGMRPKFHMRK